jgi:hypothetical protein
MAVRGKAREAESGEWQGSVAEVAQEHAHETLGTTHPTREEIQRGVPEGRILDDLSHHKNEPPVSEGTRPRRTEEEKRASFSRLASIRTSNALDAIRGLGHLANPTTYSFDQESVDKIIGALDSSIEALRRNFTKALEPKEEGRRKRGERNLSFRV